MNKRIFGLCVVTLFLSILFTASLAWAEGDELLYKLSSSKGNIRSGNLRLHLGLDVREIYDDNIYNTAINEKDDFITAITPGALVSIGDRNSLELGYAAGLHYYSNYSDEDFVSQHGRASIKLKSPKGLRFNFRDIYLKTEDPRPEERQIRASHWTNDIDASLGYSFPAEKLMAELIYKMRYLKYDQAANKAFNKVSNTVGLAVYYKFLPKTAAFVEYDYEVQDFFDSTSEITDKDAKTHSVLAGLKWDPSAKLSGSVKTGWVWKKYDNVRDEFGNLYIDKNLWSLEGQLSYSVTDKTRLNVGMNRSLQDTEYSGSAVYSRATNYLSTGGAVGIEQKVLPKLTVSLSAGYQKNDYNRVRPSLAARKDKVRDFGAGLTYDFRDWLQAGITYSYYNNNSNDPTRDERHNKVMVSLTAAI